MWISWKHEDTDFPSPMTFDQKVEVFYEQTVGWQLHIADLVANGGTTFGEFKRGKAGYTVSSIRHSGFAVLHICFSYIELIGSLVQAKRQSPIETFEAGLRELDGLIDNSQINDALVRRLYGAARCGLYHEGRTRPGIGLTQSPDGNAIIYDHQSGTIGISPERLPRVLKAHLKRFRHELLDTANKGLRDVFELRFDNGFTKQPRSKARQRKCRAQRKGKKRSTRNAARR